MRLDTLTHAQEEESGAPFWRRAVTWSSIALGVVWSIGFPKKASLAPDMVMSVCIGAALIGTGVLLLRRTRPATTVLSIALLWSVLASSTLLSMVVDLNRLLSSSSG